jgi:penicillin-binding protein 1A
MATITGDGLKFAARALGDKATGESTRIRRGSIIRVAKEDKGSWQIVQLPAIEAAFISLDPTDGAIRALVGGFDFGLNKFNHVTQAWRQPGSSFKPFIYSAALERGYTPATIINDAVFWTRQTGSGEAWEPKRWKYEAPCACAQLSPNQKIWCRFAFCREWTGLRAGYITRFGSIQSFILPIFPWRLV